MQPATRCSPNLLHARQYWEPGEKHDYEENYDTDDDEAEHETALHDFERSVKGSAAIKRQWLLVAVCAKVGQ